jgi:hypothetical protein
MVLLRVLFWSLVASAPAAAQELHVSPSGDDGNNGAESAPLRTLATAVKQLKENGVVVLHEGTYPISAPIELATKGTTIRGAEKRSVVLARGDYPGTVFTVSAEGVTIEGLVLDGAFVTKSRAIKGKKSAGRLTVRNCEIRRFTDHAVDLDGDDCRVEDCHIHHNLLWNAAKRTPDDAHGIVTMYSQRLVIKNCTIDHVSGDCFQGDRGGWQDVTIEGCDFSNGALEEDMAGFKKGASPGEDGIDTKVAAGQERARLIVRRTKFHDFHSSFIATPAALNLKENVDAVVDGCDISDSAVALRLRGTGRGVMWPTVINCTIHDCSVAVRYEDNLQKLRFAHNTLASCRKLFEPAPAKTPYGQGWIVTNNLFIGLSRFPREVGSGKNATLPMSEVDKATLRPTTANLKPLEGKPMEGLVPKWYAPRVEFDHTGRERSKETPTIGAYEAK